MGFEDSKHLGFADVMNLGDGGHAQRLAEVGADVIGDGLKWADGDNAVLLIGLTAQQCAKNLVEITDKHGSRSIFLLGAGDRFLIEGENGRVGFAAQRDVIRRQPQHADIVVILCAVKADVIHTPGILWIGAVGNAGVFGEQIEVSGCKCVVDAFAGECSLARGNIVQNVAVTSIHCTIGVRHGGRIADVICNTKIEAMTLSSGLAYLQGQFSTNYPQLMAGSVIAMMPMIVLFIIFQKQFVSGIATTGLKG